MKELGTHPERGLFARLLLENYPLKLLALGLAIALFALVHSDQDAQRTMYCDVVALLPPRTADEVLVSTLPAKVRVTLRGSRSRLAALQHDDLPPIQMDLRNPGRQFFYFDANMIDVPGPVQVIGIDPSSVQLSWRPRADRRVPVRVQLHGAPESGFVVAQPVASDPSSVGISGPKDEIDAVSEVYTDEVPIDGLGAGSHQRRVQLEPLPGHLVFTDQNAVNVQLEVQPELGERTFKHLDVATLGGGDCSLRPSAVNVTIRGPTHSLGELEQEQIVPYVEVSPANSGVEVMDVKVRGVPDGFSVVRVSPSSLLVKHVAH